MSGIKRKPDVQKSKKRANKDANCQRAQHTTEKKLAKCEHEAAAASVAED